MITPIRVLIGIVVLAGILSPLVVQAQDAPDVHPKKEMFTDAQSWPATGPEVVSLNAFQPFRAVYERTYMQALGPKAGEPRTDHVIITAEEVGWDGIPAIAISVIDTGAPQYDDTSFRGLFTVISKTDLTVLFELGPIPGKGKDYYVARFMDDKIAFNQLTTDTGDNKFQAAEGRPPGFGPGSWVIASLDLQPGQKIRLAPLYSPQANPLTGFSTIGYVVGQTTYTSQAGTDYEAWMVDHTGNLSSPRVGRRYLINRPPYYLGTDRVNLDTGENKYSIRLVDFSFLNP